MVVTYSPDYLLPSYFDSSVNSGVVYSSVNSNIAYSPRTNKMVPEAGKKKISIFSRVPTSCADMLGRKRLVESLLKNPLNNQFAGFCTTTTEKGKGKTFRRRVVPFLLFSLTGGVALSAVNDLAIYGGCSSKALEKASQSQAVIDALGEPIERGPWYNASLAVAHNRSSVSCTFPVSGSRGTGIFQLKAVRPGDDALLPALFPFLRRQNWEILMMEALIHIPSNDEKNQTLRINLSDAAASAIPYPGNKPPSCTRSQDPSTLES